VVVLSVAMDGLLEVQVTWPVKFSVAPDAVVPIAMNCPVCPGDATD
jgi:hypothetical protein